jgi:anti-sigma factor RsiW
MSRDRHPREDLTAFVDGALEANRIAEVREHLASCPSCRVEEERLRGAVAALAALPPAPAFPPSFATRLEARLREEQDRRPRLVRFLSGLAASFPRGRLALAGAAAVLVVGVGTGVLVHLGNARERAMVRDLELLQDYETASAVGVDTPEDALIVARLDQLDPGEGKP